MSYITDKPHSAAERKHRILSLVRDRKFHSEKAYNFFYRRLSTLYDLYRGTMRTRMQPFRNNAHVPHIFTTIQSDVAKKVETLFSDIPILTFSGFGPNDAAYARKHEALITAQFEDSRILRKALEVFITADLYGTSVIQFGWETRERDLVQVSSQTLPLSGEVVRDEKLVTYRDFDGPNFDVVDLLDFFPQPGVRDIEEMEWCIRRRWVSFERIQEDAARGVYDQDAVDELARLGGNPETPYTDYRNFRFSRMFGEVEQLSIFSEPLAKPVEILEYWGKVPSELTADGTNTERVITVANGGFVLRDRPNPFWAARKPFLAYSPTPDPHHFFAIGKAEIIAKLQIVANRQVNQRLDVIDRLIDPTFIYNEDSGFDPTGLYLAPNKWIGISGPVTDQFAPITPDMRGVQFSVQQEQEIWGWIQQATGIIDDVVIGQGGKPDTARGTLARSEAVQVRLMLEARLMEKMMLEPLGDAYMALNKQFLETPRELLILGESAIKDPVTGESPDLQREVLSFLDLLPSYPARARGMASRLGKGVRQQNLTLLMQAAAANPYVAGAVNWLNFFRTIFREFEIENVNELIATSEEFQRAQQLAAGNAGSNPTVAGTPTQPVSGVPQFIGAQ